MQQRPRKLLDQVREAIRLNLNSIRTEETCVHRIKRFVLFHNKRRPFWMDCAEMDECGLQIAGESSNVY